MGKAKEFNYQSSAVATPSASTSSYYADLSGRLKFVNPAGTVIDANTAFITTSTNIAVLTGGIAVFPGGSAAVLTSGTVYGTTGSLGVRPFILGEPNLWIRAVGPNGELGAIPFYTRTGAI